MGERKESKEIVSKISLEAFPGAVLNRCGLLRVKLNKVKDFVFDEDMDHYAKRHILDALGVIKEIEVFADKANEDLVITKKKLTDCQNLIRRLEKR